MGIESIIELNKKYQELMEAVKLVDEKRRQSTINGNAGLTLDGVLIVGDVPGVINLSSSEYQQRNLEDLDWSIWEKRWPMREALEPELITSS